MLTRAELVHTLLLALLYEEEVTLRDYKAWVSQVDSGEVRDFLEELVDESRHHKGQILEILEHLEGAP